MTDLDRALLRDLFAVLPDNVLVADADRKILFIGRLEVGYEGTDVIGMDALEFIAPDARSEYAALYARVLETMEPAELVAEVVGGDGQREWYESKLIPLSRAGESPLMVMASRNVTARVQAEQELAMLRSLLPVCSWCKKIRTQDGEWQTVEEYLQESDGTTITHGMCPECDARLTREWSEGGD